MKIKDINRDIIIIKSKIEEIHKQLKDVYEMKEILSSREQSLCEELDMNIFDLNALLLDLERESNNSVEVSQITLEDLGF